MKKIKDYSLLIKPSLSIMVVFSSVMSFALTKGSESYVDFWKMILLLFAGGMLVTGSAKGDRCSNEADGKTSGGSWKDECNRRMDFCHRHWRSRCFHPWKLFQLADGWFGCI